ncbi:MAG: hydroxymethylpyrimidine/phosphomethylpyrimidine kinase [Nitrospinaceae bacterium]|nr:MAG: hydroxymethylpyrimidine/phosphomethylpyrimidine kinase [Nitrospinaceae bacterium]
MEPVEEKKYFRALTIAGSDNSGGAGIQADLKTFSALGCYGTSVITALTAQNTCGVRGIQEIPSEFVVQQIQTIVDDVGVDAVKTGMLFNSPIILAVAGYLRENPVSSLVVDPVMFAKSGDRLLLKDAIDSFCRELIPLATVLTPNISETEAILGRPIDSRKEMEKAAKDLCQMGPEAVVVKGGNLLKDSSDDCLFIRGGKTHWLKQKRVPTDNVHGTGCTFSAAIAAFLARSFPIEDAVREAKSYLTGAIQAGDRYQLGKGKGPVMHFYKTWKQ